MAELKRTEAVIVGAGPAGLAVAACLKRAGLPFILLEASDRIGSSWHRHYDRLHLHTDKARSALPHFPFPKGAPKYPSRDQVIGYLEAYAEHFGLTPRLNQQVVRVTSQGGEWLTCTADSRYASRHLVIATGYNREPYVPTWPGQASFAGPIVHSSAYKSGTPYRGKRVLVVGFGNSGGEIAIDLYEHGAKPCLAVRGPVNLIPRDLLSVPFLAFAIPLQKLPPKVADALNAPLLRLIFGDLSKLGLEQAKDGPFVQIKRRARIPLIDVGTIRLIRDSHVKVRPGIERFSERGVVFADGSQPAFRRHYPRHRLQAAIGLSRGCFCRYRPNRQALLERKGDASQALLLRLLYFAHGNAARDCTGGAANRARHQSEARG